MAAKLLKQKKRLSLSGIGGLPPEKALEALGLLLRTNQPASACVLPLNLRQWRQSYANVARNPLWRILLEESENGRMSTTENNLFRNSLQELDSGASRRTFLETHLQQEIAHVLRLSSPAIDRLIPLDTLGFDSLMALELRNRLELKLGLSLPVTMLWSGNRTIAHLTEYLAQRMNVSLEPQETPAEEPSGESFENQKLLKEIEKLSEEEAATLLARKLDDLEQQL